MRLELNNILHFPVNFPVFGRYVLLSNLLWDTFDSRTACVVQYGQSESDVSPIKKCVVFAHVYLQHVKVFKCNLSGSPWYNSLAMQFQRWINNRWFNDSLTCENCAAKNGNITLCDNYLWAGKVLVRCETIMGHLKLLNSREWGDITTISGDHVFQPRFLTKYLLNISLENYSYTGPFLSHKRTKDFHLTEVLKRKTKRRTS
jgi:hypothetical protein